MNDAHSGSADGAAGARAPSHTPGPWELVDEPSEDNFARSIYGPAGDYKALLIGRVDQNFSYADGEVIVRACNAYDELLAALRKAEDFLSTEFEALSTGRCDDEDAAAVLATIRAAIAKAEGR